MSSPFVMVIFGATGDLTGRKLMPALFKMYSEGLLPARNASRSEAGGGEDFYIVAVARRELGTEGFVEMIRERIIRGMSPSIGLRVKEIREIREKWDQFSRHIIYHQGYFEEKESYERLGKVLEELEKKIVREGVMRYFYLATPPKNYATILENLKSSGLSEGCGLAESNKWTRILIEKPFGQDADHAERLEKMLSDSFFEKQIYRIDHYLGKEAIQNIIAFRFANGIFEPIWNKDYIDHVQITMVESAGLEDRIGFYEGIGALRDVMQNHMLQMMALVGMEQPRDFSVESVRDARARFLNAVMVMDEGGVGERVVRGQYVSAISEKNSKFEIRNSKLDKEDNIKGYREEDGVEAESETETFVAMKLFIDTPRWKGVPWYLRTGKRLKKDAAEISIIFKQTCHILFREVGCPEEGNILTLRVSPDEGIGIRVIIKKPGHEFKLTNTDLHFKYKEDLAGEKVLEAYEKILEQVFKGDQMLFNRSDEMRRAWEIITPVVNAWKKERQGLPDVSDDSEPSLRVKPTQADQKWTNSSTLYFYPAFSSGPAEADLLIERDGRKWILR